ncbi:MAG: DUF4339 domain-containing protein [Myxococcales bacterium]|nr:MAG: DUF4339 domain-containing protein [Myxococcales bacterium]
MGNRDNEGCMLYFSILGSIAIGGVIASFHLYSIMYILIFFGFMTLIYAIIKVSPELLDLLKSKVPEKRRNMTLWLISGCVAILLMYVSNISIETHTPSLCLGFSSDAAFGAMMLLFIVGGTMLIYRMPYLLRFTESILNKVQTRLYKDSEVKDNPCSEVDNIATAKSTNKPNCDNPSPDKICWYIHHYPRQKGPYSAIQFKKMFANNEISFETIVWRFGMSEWKKISEIQELLNIIEQINEQSNP